MENEIVTLYHVTPKKNLESILENGLDPELAQPVQYKWKYVRRKLEEKGIDTSDLDPDSETTPTYYKNLPYKIIWLGDEEVVEKYGKVVGEGKLDIVAFRIDIPKKELEEISVPNPALYEKTNFEEWFKHTQEITNPLARIRDGLGIRKINRENMFERYSRRMRMVVVKSKIKPEYLTRLF